MSPEQMKFCPSLIIYESILMEENEEFSLLKHSVMNFTMMKCHSCTLPTVTISNNTAQTKNHNLINTYLKQIRMNNAVISVLFWIQTSSFSHH